MKKASSAILFVLVFFVSVSWRKTATETISEGQQPQISVDKKGVIRVVFGQQDKIFCATSADNGVSFSNPVLVANVPEMHLGMSRGPQIASSDKFSVITAMDKAGNIHWFRLNAGGKWENMGIVNDLRKSAPEGLMGIAADDKDNFYAAWLDTRTGGHNQIYFSSLNGNSRGWSKNIMAYHSPDGHVCECCKPNIAVKGAQVDIMFRNWLNGARDLYLAKSENGGKSFNSAEKLGNGTWKLNGCPMDGGGIIIGDNNLAKTTWQRSGTIFYAEPGKPEIAIGAGRICSIAGTGANTLIALQKNDSVKLIALKSKSETFIGNGSFLKPVALPGNKTLCIWEQNNQIKYKRI